MGWLSRDRVAAKGEEQLLRMRVAGLLVGRTLEMLRTQVREGVTTGHLDALAETFIRDHGGIPNFQLVPGYRHTLCTSVNEEVVHGIPGSRVLEEGDVISIDIPNKRLDLKVSEEVLSARRKKFVPKPQKTDSVFLNRYRAFATSGVEGAVLKDAE